MKKLISAMFFAVLAATAAMADALDTTLFSKKCELTVSGYSGSTALENFPVLVRLAAGSPSGFATVVLHFADAKGLKTSDGKEPTGFEVAGADGKYVYAKAKIDGETIVASAAGINKISSVKYAWYDLPLGWNVVNGENLPLGVFKKDQ
jgi:hypothetical protein